LWPLGSKVNTAHTGRRDDVLTAITAEAVATRPLVPTAASGKTPTPLKMMAAALVQLCNPIPFRSGANSYRVEVIGSRRLETRYIRWVIFRQRIAADRYGVPRLKSSGRWLKRAQSIVTLIPDANGS
jgi:hypothetical protein